MSLSTARWLLPRLSSARPYAAMHPFSQLLSRNFNPASLKTPKHPPRSVPHPRILWEKNFLIARLIVGRAHPLAGWWRSVFRPLRPKADLRNRLSVTSRFRRAIVHLAAKRETEARHASPMYVSPSKRFISFREIICPTEHGANWYAWINITYNSIFLSRENPLILNSFVQTLFNLSLSKCYFFYSTV